MVTYDELSYESTPITETPPEPGGAGRPFGLNTPHPERARVLELGCASGGNLTPMAWHLPEARFLGIEPS